MNEFRKNKEDYRKKDEFYETSLWRRTKVNTVANFR